MSRLMKVWVSVGLACGLVSAGLPAGASEVVKLARLVVSGKRSTNELPRTAPAERRSPSAGTQIHGGSGNEAGTAPTPTRGVS